MPSSDIDRIINELDKIAGAGRNARGRGFTDVALSLPAIPGIHYAISIVEDSDGVTKAFVRLPEDVTKEWRWRVTHANRRNDGKDYKRDCFVRSVNRYGLLCGAFPMAAQPTENVEWRARQADTDSVIQVGDGRGEPEEANLTIMMEVEIMADYVVWLPGHVG